VALVSGGFIDIIEPMIQSLSIKYYKANTLEIVDGFLTGGLIGPVIDRAAKASALRDFATSSEVAMENTVAIGDGANDLDMMAIAGLSIAFNAKPIVAESADLKINEPSLRSVQTLIGI
jgi:phosphoserine phosphatase